MTQQSAGEFIQAVQNWASTKRMTNIAVRENKSPDFHLSDGYRLVYEITFLPKALNKAQLQFSVTHNGYPSICIEKYDRVASRLGLRSPKTSLPWCAAGFEPKPLDVQSLVAICDEVSGGRFVLSAYQTFNAMLGCRIKMQNDQFTWIKSIDAFAVGRPLAWFGLARKIDLSYADWGSPD